MCLELQLSVLTNLGLFKRIADTTYLPPTPACCTRTCFQNAQVAVWLKRLQRQQLLPCHTGSMILQPLDVTTGLTEVKLVCTSRHKTILARSTACSAPVFEGKEGCHERQLIVTTVSPAILCNAASDLLQHCFLSQHYPVQEHL